MLIPQILYSILDIFGYRTKIKGEKENVDEKENGNIGFGFDCVGCNSFSRSLFHH
jgi:hypothetical protein